MQTIQSWKTEYISFEKSKTLEKKEQKYTHK